jgi:hypothetical protein
MAHEEVHQRSLGVTQYELKDHLGNVRAVISDRRTLQQADDGLGGTINYYQGELMSYSLLSMKSGNKTDFINFKQVRSSVTTHWLKQFNLRQFNTWPDIVP